MTLNDFTRRLIDRCVELGQRPPTRDEAETLLPDALDLLSTAISVSDRASLLERRFRFTYTGATGNAPFSTLALDTGATLASVDISGILTETIGVVKHDDDAGTITTFHRIPEDSEIAYERNQEFFYYDPYIILNSKIRARKAADPPDAGLLADGFLTFQASYTPLITGMPSSGELDTDLIVIAVGLSKAGMESEAAAQ